MPAADKQQLVRLITAELSRGGHRYRIDWAALDYDSLREVHRFLRDLDYDKIAAARARLMPWRGR